MDVLTSLASGLVDASHQPYRCSEALGIREETDKLCNELQINQKVSRTSLGAPIS